MLQRAVITVHELNWLHALYFKLLLLEEQGGNQQLPIEELGLCLLLEFKEDVGVLG